MATNAEDPFAEELNVTAEEIDAIIANANRATDEPPARPSTPGEPSAAPSAPPSAPSARVSPNRGRAPEAPSTPPPAPYSPEEVVEETPPPPPDLPHLFGSTNRNTVNDDIVPVSPRSQRIVVPTPSPATVTPDAPQAIPPPAPVPPPAPRRRHAAVPRRRTYQEAIRATSDEIEELCRRPFFCGPFSDMCLFCGAKFFTKEPKNRQNVRFSCCKNGFISIPVPRCPDALKPLFTERSHRSQEFLSNIRAANSLFAMASFKTSTPNRAPEGQGRWCFSVCGQIYHYTVGVPSSQELQNPRLAHYYFLDVEEVLERRNDFLENRISPDTVRLIERCLREHNRYINAYHTMGEVLREEANRRGGVRPVDDVVIAFCRDSGMNVRRRQFNLPESRSEIAAVFYGTDPPFNVDLKLYPRTVVDAAADPQQAGTPIDRRHELKNLHPMSDPLVYPLLFPYGDDGWSIGLRHADRRITMREFYRYRIQCRDMFSALHNGGKLFQQYLVDAWVRVETDYLWYIRQHQQNYRYAASEAIRRVIAAHPDHANRVGRAIILPPNFQGGPRQMQRLYLDAMAVVARHGKPDLFITFTCNPQWPEIRDNLEYNQKPENRPDLICRIFKIKFTEFLDDLIHKQLYGVVKNYHYVIEFQKRGLPHAHIVITFIADDQIRSPEQVDAIVSAIIPDQRSQSELYELVAMYQVHRPCGSLDPTAPCTSGGRCKKYFPKEYAPHTILGATADHRPKYKRPNDGRVIRLGDGKIVRNTRIVPYNPYALAKYHTHINFEVVGSVESLKYLYKYVTKGHDCITIRQDEEGEDEIAADGGAAGQRERIVIDEVRNYLDCRYVSSMEAAWRLLEFPLHGRSHAVIVLPVHLPGRQNITFGVEDDVEELEARLAKRTKLEAWFELNRRSADSRQYRYFEIPEHYVWENRNAQWNPRRQVSKAIGCIAEVTPTAANRELYFLRLLLRHVPGASSFEDLRTVNGTLLDTFREACDAMNLLRHPDEYDRCLQEAALLRHPAQMRRLFALIICIMTDETIDTVPILWQRYRDRLIEDYLHRGMSRRDALTSCIRYIDDILRRNLADLDAERLGTDDDDDAMEDIDIDPFLTYTPDALNPEQAKIFLRIVRVVCTRTGTVLPEIQLRRGKTAHRAFRLPIHLSETSSVGWPLEHRESQNLQRIGLILWDEAPMTHRYAVETVDRYFRELCGSPDATMGGKCFVFGGDFRQVLPVIPRGHRASIINASLKRLDFWNEFTKLRLQRNMRTGGGNGEPLRELGGRSFDRWLLALGEGRLPYVTIEGYTTVPADLISIPQMFHSATLDDLISFVYPEGVNHEDVGNRAILCPTNAMVDTVNDLILRSVEGDEVSFVSVNECVDSGDDEFEIPDEVLDAVNVAGLPPHVLKLKVGAIVMLLRNLDIEFGECNGSRMRITRLGEHLIEYRSADDENENAYGGNVQLSAGREIVHREEVSQEADLLTAFGGAEEEEFFENLDTSQLIRNAAFEDIVDDRVDDDVNNQLDPYVGEDNLDIPLQMVPYRDRNELEARVSIVDRPGTSGIGLRRPSPPLCMEEDSSSSS
ncbi:hypothetical protein NQ315_007932 [Exocentrus adspersus]|uniref:ATP-dependent DNA helicase n=1 Tax=Exocentrus adspersus TaxID=1586481 RepID=A0AAV8V5N0_9CUCU|nr:hypothetical protein NQ315_007932 [Exocentrus adspersus]